MFGIGAKKEKLDWHVEEIRTLHRILVESLEIGHESHIAKAAYNIQEHARRAQKLIAKIEHYYGSETAQTGFAKIVVSSALNAAARATPAK